MLRENGYYGLAREYRNNNIILRYDKETIDASKKDSTLILSEVLSLLDCEFIGDTYCLSNYETGHTIYNCHSDRVYIFPWSYIEKLEEGKTIRLYARIPDNTDRELIEASYN